MFGNHLNREMNLKIILAVLLDRGPYARQGGEGDKNIAIQTNNEPANTLCICAHFAVASPLQNKNLN